MQLLCKTHVNRLGRHEAVDAPHIQGQPLAGLPMVMGGMKRVRNNVASSAT